MILGQNRRIVMGLLHYLDVLIGYALAMAILATLIATFAGMWLTALRTHTQHLRSALATAIGNVQGLTPEEGKTLAAGVLMDRLVKARAAWPGRSDPTDGDSVIGKVVRWFRGYASETVHREELALMLLRKAADGDAVALKAVAADAAAAGQSASGLLRSVEATILAEESAGPELPAHVWRMRALAAHVPALSSQIFTHFDNLMDRVEDNVAASGKVVSLIAAAAFLCWYPVDSLDMVKRLSRDSVLRARAVSVAGEVNQSPAAGQGAELREAGRELKGLFGDVLDRAVAPGIPDVRPGVVITWAMVGMGSPFWLGVLNRLLGLRSLVAQRGSEQRTLRDQDQRVVK
jgi:hypothetical protein